MITITPIPAFNDNYIWHLWQDEEHWVVDPGDSQPVIEALAGRELSGILLTHHHMDHTGGVDALTRKYHCPVFGPGSISGVTQPISAKDTFTVLGREINVISVPGHTLDHIALIMQDGAKTHLFCGDTLFAAGCGRLFEGTPSQMHQSLQSLAHLPNDTLVYCAHEYTRANLDFALAVEPGNADIERRIASVDTLRAANRPSLPSSIRKELATNPFMRCDKPAVRARAIRQGAPPNADTVEIFATLRRWKDNF